MHVSTQTDPKAILDRSHMSGLQLTAVAICIFLNALDGFDILSISFASPGIASEWAISPAALGVVLGMELFGMAVGSIALGGLADRFGRRPTILFCLLLMAGGMYGASLVGTVNQLLVARFVTGLGIGGMLASTNAMTAEFSNAKHRNLAVLLMAAGYPVGAILGGSVSTMLVASFDWRAIFVFGAACTAAALVVVWIALPESIEYLATSRPANALARINALLSRMGHETIARLPNVVDAAERRSGFATLLSPRLRASTLLLTFAYFAHIMTFYYILKWIPQIVVGMGYAPSTAGAVLVWANVGGATGAVTLGLLSNRFGLRRMIMTMLVLAFAMVTIFGVGYANLSQLSLVAAVTGFFTNGGVVGFYALMARVFPADVRAGGTGLVIGVGRGGAALGPVLAGFLFAAGFDLLVVSAVMGAGAVLAAVAIFLLRPAAPEPQPVPATS
jgi:benzoate transport